MKNQTLKIKKMSRLFFILLILICTSNIIKAQSYNQQSNGDYRSVAPLGKWDSLGTWQVYNASSGNWVAATTKPTSSNNVFIQYGTRVTLTMNESCNDIYMCNSTMALTTTNRGKVDVAIFELAINGRIRSYKGDSTSIASNTSMIDTVIATNTNVPFLYTAASTTGKIKIVGGTRIIVNTGEWGSFSSTAVSTTAPVEVALNVGAVGTFLTNFKASSWKITSGTLIAQTLAPDNGTAGVGDVNIASGATLISQATGNAFQRTGTSLAGTLNVDGMLIFSSTSPKLQMTSIIFGSTSTIEYNLIGAQNLAGATTVTGAAIPSIYNNLVLSGNGVKTLYNNITVNGKFTLKDTSTFALSNYTLTYGSNASLEYAGAVNQIISNAEMQSSIPNLIINNTSGVNASFNIDVSNATTFTRGRLLLNNYNISSSTYLGGNDTSYIQNNGTGLAIAKQVGLGSVTLPIGLSTTYNPLTISAVTPSSDIKTAVKTPITNSIANTANAINAEWSVNSSVASTANIQFGFKSANGGTGFSSSSPCDLGNYTTSYSIYPVGVPTGSNLFTVAKTGLNIPVSTTNLYVIGNTNSIVFTLTASITAGGATTFCSGSSVNLSANTGIGYTYVWKNNGNVIVGATSSSFTATLSGIYTCTISVGSVTATSNSISVTVNSGTTPTVASVTPVCAGSNINLSASTISGATYSWSGPNGFTSNLQNPTILNVTTTATGTYSVIATSGSCPSIPVSTVVTVNPLPTSPSISYNSPICVGSNLNLIASSVSGGTYVWSGPNGFTSTIQNPTINNITLSATGTYNATVTVNGCTSSTSSTSVNVNTPIVFSISASGPTSFINGGSVTLTTTTVAGATYQWYNGLTPISGANTNSYIATLGGNYSLNITLNGCVASSNTIVVSVLGLPTASITANGPTTFCSGSSVLLTAYSASGYTYQWLFNGNIIPSALSSTYTASIPGNYSVVVTSSSNVSATSNTITVSVTPYANASITTSGSTTFCSGGSVQLNAISAPGNTYQWKNGNTIITGANSSFLLTNQQGSYTVVITNASCSVASNPVNVTVNPIPTLISSITPISICSGSSIIYNANASIPSSSITWSRPVVAGISNNAATGASTINEVLTNSNSIPVTANYQFTVSANGCSSSSNLPVIVNPNPVLTSSTTINPICSGTSFSYTPTVNTTNTSITWQRNAVGGIINISSNGNGSINEILTLSGSLSSTATYAITLNTTSGCSNSAFITVNVKPNPSFTSSIQMGNSCSGSLFSFTPSTNITSTINWSRSSLAGISNPASSGTGSISETLINTTSNPIKVIYVLSASANGCSVNGIIDTFIVNPLPVQPQITANGIVTGQIDICNGESLTLSSNAIGVLSYNWYSNGVKFSQSNNVQINTASIYKLTVTNSYSCVSPFSNEIEVRVPCDIGIYMPTLFTPNNDNDNDIAMPSLPGISKIALFKILNRWGNVVFETTDFNKGWDGNFNGEAQPQDEYFWKIEVITNLNTILSKQGKLILVR